MGKYNPSVRYSLHLSINSSLFLLMLRVVPIGREKRVYSDDTYAVYNPSKYVRIVLRGLPPIRLDINSENGGEVYKPAVERAAIVLVEDERLEHFKHGYH